VGLRGSQPLTEGGGSECNLLKRCKESDIIVREREASGCGGILEGGGGNGGAEKDLCTRENWGGLIRD